MSWFLLKHRCTGSSHETEDGGRANIHTYVRDVHVASSDWLSTLALLSLFLVLWLVDFPSSLCLPSLYVRHRWARLQEQQSSTTLYWFCLLTKENILPFKRKLPCPFSICNKQTEVAVSVFCLQPGNMETQTWRYRDMETWRHGHGTWKHGEMETWRYGDTDVETWRYGHRDRDMQTWTWRQGILCSFCKRKFVVCPFVDGDTKWSYPFAKGLNRLNGLNGLAHLWWR
jgi:hypothetical protein